MTECGINNRGVLRQYQNSKILMYNIEKCFVVVVFAISINCAEKLTSEYTLRKRYRKPHFITKFPISELVGIEAYRPRCNCFKIVVANELSLQRCATTATYCRDKPHTS